MSITRTAPAAHDHDVTGPALARRRWSLRIDLAALVMLVVTGMTVGGWALVDPAGFYLGFPGLGRRWVLPDGPFNEHLLRDVGALNLALGVLAIAAAVRLIGARDRTTTRITGLVWLVFSMPHLLYHLDHMGTMSRSDAVLQSASLGAVVGAALLLVRPHATPGQAHLGAR